MTTDNSIHRELGKQDARLTALEQSDSRTGEAVKEMRAELTELKIFLAKCLGAGFVLMTIGQAVIGPLVKRMLG